jgi:hypothetical protein
MMQVYDRDEDIGEMDDVDAIKYTCVIRSTTRWKKLEETRDNYMKRRRRLGIFVMD